MAVLYPIRLQQAAKDYNVGMLELVSFLATKGHIVENKPTTKLSIDQLELLSKQFSSSSLADSFGFTTKPNNVNQEPNSAIPNSRLAEANLSNATTIDKIIQIRTEQGIPKTIFKYYGTQDYHFDSFEKSYLFLSPPNYFNDPFDCSIELIDFNRTEVPKIKRKSERFFKERIKNIGVCCFSRTNSSILMWAHYANSHKGFCIEFHSGNATGFNPLDVNYTDTSHKLNFHINTEDSIFNMIFTKSLDWQYERELRILETNLKHENQRKQVFNKSFIKAVYIGVNSEPSTIERIKRIVASNYKGVKLFQGYKNPNSFAINFQEVPF